jgi:filamentous hemagglutinin family protein
VKRPLKRRSRNLANWISLLAGASLGHFAHGQSVPTGGVVTAGNAAIEAGGDRSLAIRQESNRSVIRWQDFSIAEGARVDFFQPGKDAATLNIVQGNNLSTLAGTLAADGSVYLVNPNGIAITPSGLIDTRGGFVGSTLALSEEDFMSERLLFSGRGGAVTNQGSIRTGAGGVVALLGSSVANSGLISAPLGKVALGAGERMTLDLNGDGFLQLLLPSELTEGVLLSHSGNIEAAGGTVVLKADAVRQAWRDIVHVPGEIHANSVSGHDGRIVFSSTSGNVNVSGSLDVSAAQGAERGGSIDITGANVTLGGASLDASAPLEGGHIRIGGEFQGGKDSSTNSPHAVRFAANQSQPPLASSMTTTVDAASVIDVSATGEGGVGGSVVLWSDANTRMDGTLRATGAASGGAVEISSAAQVQSLALNRLELGKGGLLLLDPKDIWIDDWGSGPTGSIDFGSDPDATTHLNTDDLIGLLGQGVDISLRASNDITWDASDRLQVKVLRPAPNTPAGNLDLLAGRSVTLMGAFETGGGNWSIVANAPASLGVIDAYRDEGAAAINASWADFMNDTGALSFTLADGAGNTHRYADGINIGSITSSAFTIDIVPSAIHEWDAPWITLTQDLNVAGDVTLTGNLRISSSELAIRGNRVAWTNETTAGLSGEGTLRFFENNVLTRYGRVVGSDIVRMELGGGGFMRIYGDSAATIVQTGTPIHESEHSPAPSFDDLAQLLLPGSLVVNGVPGGSASVGNYTVTVAATNDFGIDLDVASSGYFFNLTPASTSLTIAPRTVTATVSNGAYTYGSPQAVVTLNNVVNGDAIVPVATLNGDPDIALQLLSGGFGFGARVPVGSSSFTVTGLAGARASNYILDASGVLSGTLTISPRAITYGVTSGSQVYGTLGNLPSAGFTGVLAEDIVFGTVGLSMSDTPIAHDARLRVGSYDAIVTDLYGADAGNYVLAASGHTPGVFTVTPKPLTWSVGNSSSVYGTLATSFGASLLEGVLPGDVVSGVVSPYGFTPAERTPAGTYYTAVTALSGPDANNYTLAAAGNQFGIHTIDPKPINYTFTDVSSQYGEGHNFGSVTLHGVLAGDAVWVSAQDIFRNGERVELDETTPVGEYEQRVTALNNPNYTPAASGNEGTLTITPRPLLYELPSYAFTFGDTPDTLPRTATFWGVMPWDQNRVFAGEVVIASGETLSGALSAGTYSLVMNGLVDLTGNYVLGPSLSNATLTINPRPLTWSLGASGSMYGTETFALPSVTANTLFGEIGKGELTFEIAITDVQGRAFTTRSLPGTYVARVVAIGGPAAQNYVLDDAGSTLGVHTHIPRPLYVDVPDLTVTYGEWFTLPQVTLTGVLPGDYVTLGSVAIDGGFNPQSLLDAGTYLMRVDGLSGLDAAKYDLQVSPGILTIQQRVLTPAGLVSLGFPQTSVVYGDLTRFNTEALFGTGRTLEVGFRHPMYGSNVVVGDDVRAIVFEPTIGVSSSGAYVVGTYGWFAGGLTGADAKNYVFDFNPSTPFTQLTITPRPLEVRIGVQDLAGTWVERMPYGDGLDHELVAAFLSYPILEAAKRTVLAGDDVQAPDVRIETPDGTLASIPERLALGAYDLALDGGLSGSDAGNYTIDVVQTMPFEVVRRPLTVSVSDRSWTYGQYQWFEIDDLVTIDGLLSGEEAIPQFRLESYYYTPESGATFSLHDRLTFNERTDTNTYYLTAIGLTGAHAGNYALALQGPGTLTIDPRLVTYRNTLSSSYVYGDSISRGWVEGFLDGDDVSLDLSAVSAAGRFAFPSLLNVGQYRLEANLTGADRFNYALQGSNGESPSNLWSFAVTPRPLRIDSVSLRTIFQEWDQPQVNVSGLLTGQSLAFQFRYWDSRGLEVFNDGAQEVGTYRVEIVDIAGDTLSNYRLDPSSRLSGTWTVDPLTLDLALGSKSAVYGEQAVLATLDRAYFYRYFDSRSQTYREEFGALDLQLWDGPSNFTLTRTGTSYAGTYSSNPRLDAGTYTYTLRLVPGTLASNFQLVNNTGTFEVLPRPVTLNLGADYSSVYGGHLDGTISGILFNDDVGVELDFFYDGAATAVRDVLKYDEQGRFVLSNRQEVGEHTWSVTGKLGGAKGHNYVVDFVGAMQGSLTISPRELHWQIDKQTVQYGNFAYCELSDWNCTAQAMRNPGGYGRVHFDSLVAGDSLGASLQVTQQLLDFDGNFFSLDASTLPGAYLQVITGLSGPKARNYTLAASDNLPGLLEVVPAWVNWSTTGAVYIGGLGLYGTPGQVTYSVASTGDTPSTITPLVVARYYNDANDYLFDDLSNLKAGEYYMLVVGFDGPDADKYRPLPSFGNLSGSYGSLYVYADTTFGLEFAGQGDLPPPPPVMTNTFAYADPKVGLTGGGAGAGAGASATFDLGVVDLTTSALATTEALAKVGAGNVQVKATADGRLEVRVDSGPGYAYTGAGGSAEAGLKLGRTGLVAGAEAKAGIDAGGGAGGSLGAAGDGNIEGNAGVFVYARSQSKYGYQDGKITATFDQAIGTGASAGFNTSLSGSHGSVGGGATVYSPGSLAAKFDLGGGLDGSVLSVSVDLGLSLGFGGLELSFDFSIDFDEMGRTVECFFVYCSSSEPQQPPYDQVLLQRLSEAADYQRSIQEQLLDILKTDPERADDFIRANFGTARAKVNNVLFDAQKNGYQLISDNGSLKFVQR